MRVWLDEFQTLLLLHKSWKHHGSPHDRIAFLRRVFPTSYRLWLIDELRAIEDEQ